MSGRRSRDLHSALGLILIAPFLWVGLTGTLLWVCIFLQGVFFPYHLPVATSYEGISRQVQVGQALSAARSAGKTADISRFYFPTTHRGSLRLRLADGEEWFFAPRQAQPFLRRTVAERSLLSRTISGLTRLHRGKFAEFPGQIVFSIFAAFLLIFLLTGALLLRLRKSREPTRSLHRRIAWIVCLPLASLYFSGGILNISNQLRNLPPLQLGAGFQESDWTRVLAAAEVERPGIDFDTLSRLKGALLAEYTDGGRFYLLDGGGELVLKPWTKKGWLEPWYKVHTGLAYGTLGWLAMGATGLLSVVIAITGFQLLAKTRLRTMAKGNT